MIKYLKEYRFYIILFLFILIPILSIDTATRSPRQYRLYDRVILAIIYPVQVTITWSLDSIIDFYQNYIYLFKVNSENSVLLDENRRLMNTIVNLRETQDENLRLRKLLGFKEEFALTSVLARVMAKDTSTEFRAIRINRGESSGIKKDMAVLNNEGIIGKVFRTTADTADVVTILDLLSAVDIIVKRSRARGILEGMTDELCQLRFTVRTDDIIPGDLLISSGLGGIFPKGVPVGNVTKVEKKSYGISQRIEVRPSVDFSKIEEVLVVTGMSASPVHLSNQVSESTDQKTE
jgi:rod shape-determining protein MreC